VVAEYDGALYEATLDSVDGEQDGCKYGTVTFIGYNNQETVWLSTLHPSAGQEARQRQEAEAAGQVNGESLVNQIEKGQRFVGEADGAVAGQPEAEAKVKHEEKKEPEAEKPAQAGQKGADVDSEWKEGAFCRAVYSEDNQLYEAVINKVTKDKDSGGFFADVEFLGYGNQAAVWCDDLKTSMGEEARELQKKEGAAAVAEPGSTDVKGETCQLETTSFRTFGGEGFGPAAAATKPNPATPHFASGCRVRVKDSGAEATVVCANLDDEGNEYCTVTLADGKETSLWADEIETATSDPSGEVKPNDEAKVATAMAKEATMVAKEQGADMSGTSENRRPAGAGQGEETVDTLQMKINTLEMKVKTLSETNKALQEQEEKVRFLERTPKLHARKFCLPLSPGCSRLLLDAACTSVEF